MDEQLETIRENAEHIGDLHMIIARLEKATGPDRGIDAAIQRATDGSVLHIGCGGLTNAFTASVDAALMLVPNHCYARVQTATRDCMPLAWVTDETREFSWEGISGKPAIALCIAAIKARAALIAEERTDG